MNKALSLFTKSNIGQRKSNNKERRENQSQNICIPKISKVQIHKITLLNLYAKYKKIIAATISNVNTACFAEESIPGNIGDTIAKPNQKTEKLINQSAKTENQTESIFPISYNLTKIAVIYNNQIAILRI